MQDDAVPGTGGTCPVPQRAGPRRVRRTWSMAACATAMAVLTSCLGQIASGPPTTSRSKTVTVPMRVITEGRATAELVPVYIDGHGPYMFLLDTGSTISSVSEWLAHQLQLHPTGTTTQVRGVAAATRVPLVEVTNWKLGSAALTGETVAVVSLSMIAHGVAGLLGSDEISGFGSVTLDFPHQQLRLAHG